MDHKTFQLGSFWNAPKVLTLRYLSSGFYICLALLLNMTQQMFNFFVSPKIFLTCFKKLFFFNSRTYVYGACINSSTWKARKYINIHPKFLLFLFLNFLQVCYQNEQIFPYRLDIKFVNLISETDLILIL